MAFGGVFRCTKGLQDKFGPDRVVSRLRGTSGSSANFERKEVMSHLALFHLEKFNTPLSENGIAGMLFVGVLNLSNFISSSHIHWFCRTCFLYRSSDRLLKHVRRNSNWRNPIC